MKNIKLIALLVLALTVALFAFTSCEQLEGVVGQIPGLDGILHEHVFSDATCTAPKTCECGATEGEALGHTLVTDKGYAATCMKDGLSDGQHCTVCDYKIEQTVIKATGHNYEKTYTDPTCTEWGKTVNTCTECGASYKDNTWTPTGHSYEETVVVEPTCTTPGTASYTCSACGDTYTKDIEATGHSYEESVVEPTCTVAGSTTYTCANCSDSYSEEIAKLGHVDADLDVECDREGCTAKIAPLADSTLSLYTANCLGSKLSTDYKYYVEGTVVSIESEGSGIFWIEDENGEQFYVRLPKDQDGNAYSTWTVKLLVGDKIRMYGKINKFTTSNGGFYPSMQSGTLVEILVQHPHDFTASPATCTKPAYCACGQDHGEPLGHNDQDSDNLCDRCSWRMDAFLEEIYTDFSAIKDTEKVDTAKGTATYDGTEFTAVVSKGTGSLNINGSGHMRLNKGNVLTISANNGSKIVSITFVVSSASYVDEFEAYLTAAGYEYTIEGVEVTIEVDSLTTVEIANTSTKSQRIAGIKIAYVKG